MSHILTVLRLTTSLSKRVVSLCTQNNTLWFYSLVGLEKASAEFLMQSIITLLWYRLIHCDMGRRCSHRLEIPCLGLQIYPQGKIYATEKRRSKTKFTGLLEMEFQLPNYLYILKHLCKKCIYYLIFLVHKHCVTGDFSVIWREKLIFLLSKHSCQVFQAVYHSPFQDHS